MWVFYGKSEELTKEFKDVAKWIDEELPGMVSAYKEKSVRKLGEKADDYDDTGFSLFSNAGIVRAEISRACKNVYFADKYFELMGTEFARFLIDFEEIEEDEEIENEDIEED